MNLKIFISVTLILISSAAVCQSETSVNQTDSKGRKQGHWIKKNPDQTLIYDGYFKDDHPVGEFKRYYENRTLKSVLQFSPNGKEAIATLYHENGNLASKGKYVNQKKEGKWKFYSAIFKDFQISEENFSGDLRNGLSVRFYPDSTISEKINYVNDVKQGEWTKYYPKGALMLKSAYSAGKIDGKFESWFEDGKIEFSGRYKDDARDGTWLIYNPDGSLKYKIEYAEGITKDRQMDLDEAKFLDTLEKNGEKAQDPARTDILK